MNNTYHYTIKFQENIENKSLDKFIKSKINYFDKLSQKERIKKVKEFLPNCLEIYNYFEKHFNSSPKSMSGALSEDYEICRVLSRLANYILYANDAEHITKKTKYNFYTEKEFNKKVKKQSSIEEIVDKINQNSDSSDLNYDFFIDFLIRKEQNYKKTIKQEIFPEDFNEIMFKTSKNQINYPVKEYQGAIDYFKKQIKKDSKNKDFYKKQISELVADQIICKDKLKGTIYYKDVLPDSTVIDWDEYDGFDKKHVLALLRLKPRNLSTDLGILIYDLEVLLKQLNLDSLEEEIVRLYRDDYFIKDIAQKLGIKQVNYVSAILNRISKKLIDKFEEQYEDWYYLNIVRGKYKSCSQCGEIKLINKFSKDSTRNDGYMYICKKCESVGKN